MNRQAGTILSKEDFVDAGIGPKLDLPTPLDFENPTLTHTFCDKMNFTVGGEKSETC